MACFPSMWANPTKSLTHHEHRFGKVRHRRVVVRDTWQQQLAQFEQFPRFRPRPNPSCHVGTERALAACGSHFGVENNCGAERTRILFWFWLIVVLRLFGSFDTHGKIMWLYTCCHHSPQIIVKIWWLLRFWISPNHEADRLCGKSTLHSFSMLLGTVISGKIKQFFLPSYYKVFKFNNLNAENRYND